MNELNKYWTRIIAVWLNVNNELKVITVVAAVVFLIPQLLCLWVLRSRPLAVVARRLAASLGAYALFLVALFLLCYRPLTMVGSIPEITQYGFLIRILAPFPIGAASCALALYAGSTASSDPKNIMLQKVAKSVFIVGFLVYLIQVATVLFGFNHH
jgi:hypothetical protein